MPAGLTEAGSCLGPGAHDYLGPPREEFKMTAGGGERRSPGEAAPAYQSQRPASSLARPGPGPRATDHQGMLPLRGGGDEDSPGRGSKACIEPSRQDWAPRCTVMKGMRIGRQTRASSYLKAGALCSRVRLPVAELALPRSASRADQLHYRRLNPAQRKACAGRGTVPTAQCALLHRANPPRPRPAVGAPLPHVASTEQPTPAKRWEAKAPGWARVQPPGRSGRWRQPAAGWLWNIWKNRPCASGKVGLR